MIKPIIRWMACGLLGVLGFSASGGIWRDAASDTIMVTDFPKFYPCSPGQLLATDRMSGWNKVQYDPTTSTYTVTGNLTIGDNNETDTFFQIGSGTASNETMLIMGNVLIRPRWIKGENASPYWWVKPQNINRLSIGDKTNCAIKAALKITGNLSCGNIDSGKHWGGQLHVHNGSLSAAGKLLLFGDGNILDNALVSGYQQLQIAGELWWKKGITEVKNTVFSNAIVALDNLRDEHLFTNCVFERCKTGFVALNTDARFIDCVFTNNQINWDIRGEKAVTLIDCAVGKPGNTNKYLDNPEKRIYPCAVSMRHVMVKVISEDGKPVGGAEVTVTPEQAGGQDVKAKKYFTGANGFTPGKGRSNAILLQEYFENAKGITGFTYTLGAVKNGRSGSARGIRPGQSLVTITIGTK